jgi:hypothetical protein
MVFRVGKNLGISRFGLSAIVVCILAGCDFSGTPSDTTAAVGSSESTTNHAAASSPGANQPASSTSPSANGQTSSSPQSVQPSGGAATLGSSTLLNSGSPGAAAATGAVARPGYNTGTGFFVLNGKLYDANGQEFRIRGVNRNHWDSNSAAGIASSGANAVRWVLDFTRAASDNISLIQTQSLQYHEAPIVGNWGATCASDTAPLQAIVSTWVAQAPQWTTLNRSLIVNVANEWGPTDSTVWRDTYISAIASLRAAGYTGPIMIDSGGCGQDDADLVQYSQAVFNSDPERNVIFSEHLYGGTNDYSASIQSITKGNPTVITLNSNAATHPLVPGYNGSGNSYSGISAYQISGVQGMTQINGTQPAPTNVGGVPGAWTVTLAVDSTNWGNYTGGGTLVDYNGNYALKIGRLAALAKSTGAVYIIGEFGPGDNIGPSPTTVTPAEVITTAEADGIGWLPWAWDDNDLANCTADDNWFDMTRNCGVYTQASDLTVFGANVVLNPTYGIKALAKLATSL